MSEIIRGMPCEGEIGKALANVAADIEAIGKKQRNAQQGFMYRGVDDVMNALSPILAKHGVTILPEILEQTNLPDRTSSKGATLFHTRCKIKYTFLAKDRSFETAVMIGEAMDTGDKATNKAMAIAYKYACFQVFCIPLEGESDPDKETHELANPNAPPKQAAAPPPQQPPNGNVISEPQSKRLFAMSKGQADIITDVLNKYGLTSSKDILKTQYDAICIEVEELAGRSQ